MNSILAGLFNENGWANLTGDGSVWSKNGATFDITNDVLHGNQNGPSVSFKNHGEGNQIRYRLAERVARFGNL